MSRNMSQNSDTLLTPTNESVIRLNPKAAFRSSVSLLSIIEESSDETTEDDMENFFMKEEQNYNKVLHKVEKETYSNMPMRSNMIKKHKTQRSFLANIFTIEEENDKTRKKDFQTRMQLQMMSNNHKKGRSMFAGTDIHVVNSFESVANLLPTYQESPSKNWASTLRSPHPKAVYVKGKETWIDLDFEESLAHISHSEALPESSFSEEWDEFVSPKTHRMTQRVEYDETSWWVRKYNNFWYWYENNSTSITLQRIYESALFSFNIISDGQVLIKLIRANEPIWAMISWSSLAAPYVACWTAGLDIVYDKAESQYLHQNFALIFKAIYVFPLFGIPLLLCFDIFLIFLYIFINPLRLLFKSPIFGVNRDVTNYLALREITGLFLTNVMQVCLQVYIFLSDKKGLLELEDTEIAFAVGTSILSIIYMFYKLNREAYLYGEGLFDYTLLTLQGRFNFMPFLKNITSGLLTEVVYAEDDSTNLGNYLRFDEQQLRTLMGSINSKRCDLDTLVLGRTCENIDMEQSDVVWQLLDLCALRYIEFNEEMTQEEIKKDRNKIMRIACAKEFPGLVSKLIYLKPVVNVNSADQVSGMTPLMYACERGSFPIVRRLLDVQITKKKGLVLVNLNLKCKKERTAIMYCVGCHKSKSGNRLIDINFDVLKLLLNYPKETKQMNIDLNNQDCEGRTIISYLAERGGQHAIQALKLLLLEDKNLLKLDADLAAQSIEPLNYSRINISIPDNRKMTPLIYACRMGNLRIVKLLMRHKSGRGKYSITRYQSDYLGRQALHYAVLENQEDVVAYLLSRRTSRKPDINLATNELDGESTPLMYAVIWQHIRIIEHLLKERNLRVNARDVKRRTALIRGCRAGSAKGVRYLLHHVKNLDVLATDKFNKGAWDFAKTPVIKAVLAHNIKNQVFVENLHLSEDDFKSREYLQEKVMLHTNFQDEFTISMLLIAFDNNPDIVNAAYDRVRRQHGNLDQLQTVLMRRLHKKRHGLGLLSKEMMLKPLNNTYANSKLRKRLGGRNISFELPRKPLFRQNSRVAWH